MNKDQLNEGTLLKYIGKGFKEFQENHPFMEFLGYDSMGWYDLWVNYLGHKICVSWNEVEIVK
ncbi:hypothetical protein [Rubrolithibacter danxiaensis]|uniref:hypothetical protein n=1 Tax=Rubrolithibacter danxiaensis TaxID=3390805 RepID=UPI003BF7F0C5